MHGMAPLAIIGYRIMLDNSELILCSLLLEPTTVLQRQLSNSFLSALVMGGGFIFYRPFSPFLTDLPPICTRFSVGKFDLLVILDLRIQTIHRKEPPPSSSSACILYFVDRSTLKVRLMILKQ
jgi:hypothetical protein